MKEYIERTEAINAIRQYQYPYGVEFLLANIPAADVVEVRHGRWMDAESDDGCTVWHCSACSCPVKTIGGYPIYRHCLMCGARMDKEDEHEAG